MTISGIPMADLVHGLLYLIVLLIGAWCKKQDAEIRELKRDGQRCDKDREAMRKEVMERWVRDAETYVTKQDFNSLASEIKNALVRIEDKIEKLRG